MNIRNGKLCVTVCFGAYGYILSSHLFYHFIFFHMVRIAQLITINWNEHNDNARSTKFIGLLESIKQLREQYEYRVHEFSLWESNSIGLSSSNEFKFMRI